MADIRVVIQKPVNGSSSGVQSVTGNGVDNTDPLNPVLSFPTTDEIGALKQGVNTLTENLSFQSDTGSATIEETIDLSSPFPLLLTKKIEIRNTGTGEYTRTTQSPTLYILQINGNDFLRLSATENTFGKSLGLATTGANTNGLYFQANIQSLIGTSDHGKGFQYKNYSLDLSNVVWGNSLYDNVIPPMKMIIDNVQQKHTVTDYTDAFTIPNGTNNATLTMTNAIDKDVTVTATSFAKVGDSCIISNLLGAGFPIIVPFDANVELVDSDGIATDSFGRKGLERVNDVGGKVQIQLY